MGFTDGPRKTQRDGSSHHRWTAGRDRAPSQSHRSLTQCQRLRERTSAGFEPLAGVITRRSTYAVLTPALLAICASILAAQLLVPPFIGPSATANFPNIPGSLPLVPKLSPPT